jgi:hypothetical protein
VLKVEPALLKNSYSKLPASANQFLLAVGTEFFFFPGSVFAFGIPHKAVFDGTVVKPLGMTQLMNGNFEELL